MHINNKNALMPLIGRFVTLRLTEFSTEREHRLDDLFMDLNRSRLAPGSRQFKDEVHKGLRYRCFTYESDDGKCKISCSVRIVKVPEDGVEVRRTEFSLEHRFRNRKQPTSDIHVVGT